MNGDMKVYVATKIGDENVDGFKVWAFVGMNPKKTEGQPTIIDKWNMVHPRERIKDSMNAWDAVDRMIEVWKERFG